MADDGGDVIILNPPKKPVGGVTPLSSSSILIDNVGHTWHKLWSVRMAILGTIYASAGSAWLLLPADWKPDLSEPVRWVLAVVGVLLAAAPGITRVIAQPKLAPSCVTVPDDDNAEHA